MVLLALHLWRTTINCRILSKWQSVENSSPNLQYGGFCYLCLHLITIGKELRARLICRLACVLTWRRCHHEEWSWRIPTKVHLRKLYIIMF
jgi:hypothetical protein